MKKKGTRTAVSETVNPETHTKELRLGAGPGGKEAPRVVTRGGALSATQGKERYSLAGKERKKQIGGGKKV